MLYQTVARTSGSIDGKESLYEQQVQILHVNSTLLVNLFHSYSLAMSPSMQHVDVLVLGAGPTGLGAARRLNAQGHKEWLLLDAFDRPGGMAITERDSQGFMWDLGGHVIHSHFDAFNDAIACHDDWVHPTRGGWVRVQDEWCPTPIQRHLGNLKNGKQISQELVEIHEQQAQSSTTATSTSTNLEEYYRNTFGKTLDETFFAPFNFKQWAWPLKKLNHSWTSLRAGSKVANVPAPNSALVTSDRPADMSSFPYPRLGTGSLWQSVANHLPAERQRYNTYVVSIDLDAHVVTLNDGERISYGHCISSLPLNRTIDLVNAEKPQRDIPLDLVPELKHSSTTIVGLGFEGSLPKALEGRTWVFGADADVSFHRATILTNFSSSLSCGANGEHEGQRWSIMFETSTSEHRQMDISKEALVQKHLGELRRWGAIDDSTQPISTWYKHLVLGYPIPFLGRDPLLLDDAANGILQRFERHGFFPRGRFGGWRYESSNQDYAFVQGVEAVDLILAGARETVYWPGRADKVVVPAPFESIYDDSESEKTASPDSVYNDKFQQQVPQAIHAQ